MKISINIDYRGSSKILKRLCQAVNYLSVYANGDMLKEVYDVDEDGVVDNAALVNGHNVYKDVPADAQFTDTIYDDTYVRGRVRANANNITLIMSTLFNAETYYLIDSKGNVIIDSQGNPIYTAQYKSKMAELQKSVDELRILVEQLQMLGLSVKDGKIQQTIESR